jgi:predicted RNA-binding protein with PUA-like domain
MARWLFKSEPDEYSFADLENDGEAVWDGISNALALKHLRSVQVGDRVLLYHTGKEKAVVGEMKVASVESDPFTVKVEPVQAWTKPVTLKQIKADDELAGCDLVRLPRLSVTPLTEAQWERIESLAR